MNKSQTKGLERQRETFIQKPLPSPHASFTLLSWAWNYLLGLTRQGSYQTPTTRRPGTFPLHCLSVCNCLGWCCLSEKAWPGPSVVCAIREWYKPKDRNTIKLVKGHFSPGLFHTNVWSSTCSYSQLSEPHIMFGRDKAIAVPQPWGITFFFSWGLIGSARLVTSPSIINSIIREDLNRANKTRWPLTVSSSWNFSLGYFLNTMQQEKLVPCTFSIGWTLNHLTKRNRGWEKLVSAAVVKL